MRLRTFLTASAAALALLGFVAAALLLVSNRMLAREVDRAGDAVESVYAAEELEVELLAHGRGAEVDQPVSQEAQQLMEGWLERVLDFVADDQERALVSDVQGRVRDYLDVTRRPNATPRDWEKPLSAAIQATEQLVALNLTQARQARAAAEEVNLWARHGAVMVALALLLGISGTVMAVRHGLYRPLLQVREALRSYGQGDKTRRAHERGPLELREMAGEFNAMADALDKSRQAQLRFLAGVAHDLRNPLSALRLASAALTRGRVPPSEDRMRQMVGRMEHQVDRLNRMVEDLLDTTRIEAGHLDLKLEVRDLRPLAAEALELYRHTSMSHHLDLETPAAPLMIRCDATRIEQVLNNLLSNAIKYSPHGGWIRILLEQDSQHVILSVTDSGLGIALEDQARIFEPFGRVAKDRQDIPGVGLGLSVARRIVEAHGGRMDVESEPGKGSTFRISLPHLEADVRATVREEPVMQSQHPS